MSKNTTAYKLARPITLVVMIAAGIILILTDTLDTEKLLEWSTQLTQYWWVAVILILLQIVLYTFALPGSLVLWLVAPLYQPVIGSMILVTGSTLGALSAFWLAQNQTLAWTNRVKKSRLYQVLKTHGDFLTLCALRLMPNFPHSVINYGAGILRLPPGTFLISSFIGFSFKSYLYCNAIYGAVSAKDASDLINGSIIWPLIAVAVLVLIAEYLHFRWLHSHR